jgi:hypothetical protein
MNVSLTTAPEKADFEMKISPMRPGGLVHEKNSAQLMRALCEGGPSTKSKVSPPLKSPIVFISLAQVHVGEVKLY